MHAHHCSHRSTGPAPRRRIDAVACALGPRRGLERAAPLPDRVLARLAVGDDAARADVLVVVWASTAVVGLVAVVVAVVAGPALGLAAGAAVTAAAWAVARAGRRRVGRFVTFAAPAPATGAPAPGDGVEDRDLVAAERRAVAVVTRAAQARAGGEAGHLDRTLESAVIAVRGRLDAARRAAHEATALDGHAAHAAGLATGDGSAGLVADLDADRLERAAADAAGEAAAHLAALHRTLDVVDAATDAARAFEAARRLERCRLEVATAPTRCAEGTIASELAAQAGGAALAAGLRARADALVSLG